MSRLNVDISKLIISTFDDVFESIIQCRYHRVICKGGRNSTKSSMIALAFILGVLTVRCDAVCMVKYNNRVFERLVSTFMEMLYRSGLYGFFKYKAQRQELVLLDGWQGNETRYSIKFTGVDDPNKLKSFKPRSGAGGFRYIWFEEATDFTGIAEINNVVNTMGRGEGEHIVVLSYNPPKSTSSWVNIEYNAPCGIVLGYEKNSYVTQFDIEYTNEKGDITKETVRQLVHHSTYLDVIADGHADWVKTTIINAEVAKKTNYDNYRWEYLGEAIGTEGNVFRNIQELHHNDYSTKYIDRGLDFGFSVDPSVYVEWCYNASEKAIYLHNEYVAVGVDNETLVYNIKRFNKHDFTVWADSSEPRTINELRKLGLRKIQGVKKGPDSVRHGIKWLQDLNSIYINPITCPFTYKEFTRYEYAMNKLGEYTGELPDKNNHSIDATRYALCLRIDA